jgi:hypothetical protein
MLSLECVQRSMCPFFSWTDILAWRAVGKDYAKISEFVLCLKGHPVYAENPSISNILRLCPHLKTLQVTCLHGTFNACNWHSDSLESLEIQANRESYVIAMETSKCPYLSQLSLTNVSQLSLTNVCLQNALPLTLQTLKLKNVWGSSNLVCLPALTVLICDWNAFLNFQREKMLRVFANVVTIIFESSDIPANRLDVRCFAKLETIVFDQTVAWDFTQLVSKKYFEIWLAMLLPPSVTKITCRKWTITSEQLQKAADRFPNVRVVFK